MSRKRIANREFVSTVDRIIRIERPIGYVRRVLASALAAPVVVTEGPVYRLEYAGRINGDFDEAARCGERRRSIFGKKPGRMSLW